MNLIIKDKQLIFILIITLIIVSISSCSSSKSLVSAQNNLPDNRANTTNKENFEILQGIENPCDSMSERGLFEQPGANKLYELINAGYPKEIPLDEAVAVFNKFAQCRESGKSQPALHAEEVIAAIRDYNCSKGNSADKNICLEYQKIADTNMMPKGAWLDYSEGNRGGISGRIVDRGYNGYEVTTWEIYLYIRLDKYRNDLKDVPKIFHLIRLNYISSKRSENN